MSAWRTAVTKLLSKVLPVCSYHSDRIATYEQWNFVYCDDCAARTRRSGVDIPMVEFSYADSVRELEKSE